MSTSPATESAATLQPELGLLQPHVANLVEAVGIKGHAEWLRDNALPLLDVWLPALLLVGLFAALAGSSLLLRLLADSRELRRYRDRHRKGDRLDETAGRSTGTLDEWCELLREAGREKHAIGNDTLQELLASRYGSVQGWLSGMRSTSTMVGLLFTFLGLSLTLATLGDALRVDDAAEVLDALKKVRGTLPGLGTAFASSIIGVALAILIGLAETFFGMWRANLTTGMVTLSSRWIEPLLATPHGADAIPKLMDQQRRAFQDGLRELSERLTAFHTESETRNTEVVTQLVASQQHVAALTEETSKTATELGGYVEKLQGLPEENAQVWKSVLERARVQHEKVVSSIGEASKSAATVFTSSLKEAEGRVANALESFEERTTPLLGRLETSATGFAESTEAFDKLINSSTTALTVSAEHVRALAQAAERFKAALVRMEDIAEKSQQRRAEEAGEFKTVAEQILPMTEAVTLASGVTQDAAKRLEELLGGPQMERYLRELPRLTELVTEEREARLALQAAATSFGKVAETLEGMDNHASRFGQTVDLIRASHDSLTASVADIAEGRLLPVITEVVQATAREASERHEEAWRDRYSSILKDHHTALDQLRSSIDRLEARQAAVLNWLTQSAWQRLVGRTPRGR